MLYATPFHAAWLPFPPPGAADRLSCFRHLAKTLLSVQPAFGTAILRFLGFELPTARAGQSQVAELDRAAVPQLLDRLALLCSDVLAPIPAPAGSASTAGHTSGDNIPPKESASSSKSKSKGRSVAPLPSTLSLGTGRRVSERLGAWYRLIARLDPGMAAPGHDLPAGLHMGPATRPESITFAQLALVLQSLAHLACQIYRQMALSLFHPDVMLSVREILRQHVAGRLALDTVDSLPGLPVPVAATLRRCHPPQQLGFARVLIRGAAQFVCRSRNPADQVPRSLEAVDALLADPARSYLTQDEFIAWVQDQGACCVAMCQARAHQPELQHSGQGSRTFHPVSPAVPACSSSRRGTLLIGH